MNPPRYLLSEIKCILCVTCNLLPKDKKVDKAIELLTKQANIQSCYRVHEKLSELYKETNSYGEAKYHASVAKRIATLG